MDCSNELFRFYSRTFSDSLETDVILTTFSMTCSMCLNTNVELDLDIMMNERHLSC